jgi:tetratricopeptide (TPR) repeat protein
MPLPQDPWQQTRQGRQSTLRKLRYLWMVPAAGLLLGGAAWFVRSARVRPKTGPLAGYEANVDVLGQQYRKFQGRLLRNPEVEQLFEQAARMAAGGQYAAAADLLQRASADAAVPVIFNNLGVLYAEMSDRPRALAAFREALARDIDYRLTHDNIERMGGFMVSAAEPVTREVEPNNSNVNANLINVGTAVEAELAAGTNDVDSFRFVSPAAPRDLLMVEIRPGADTLEPELRMFDGDQRMLDFGRATAAGPGKAIAVYFSPQPNTAFYTQVSAAHNTSGEYTVTVRPLKKFDAYEPNDDIFSASKVTVGEIVEANIMDTDDTDFYSFESPRTGTVTIDIQARSATLIPALTTFSSDKRNTGFGPDVRTPGASLHHTMEVQEHMTYFLQVWSQGKSSGEYSLVVK